MPPQSCTSAGAVPRQAFMLLAFTPASEALDNRNDWKAQGTRDHTLALMGDCKMQAMLYPARGLLRRMLTPGTPDSINF